MGPRYRELLHDIFERKHLAEDFSLYLHRPTASDPALAPEGCESFYVLSPVPHQDSGIDWTRRAARYRDQIAAHLEATLLPGLRESIITEKLITPIDFENRLSSWKGAAFGLEPVLLQSAWFRPNNKAEDIENLFLVGAGTHPGAGIPGVISSARILDTVVPDVSAFAWALQRDPGGSGGMPPDDPRRVQDLLYGVPAAAAARVRCGALALWLLPRGGRSRRCLWRQRGRRVVPAGAARCDLSRETP